MQFFFIIVYNICTCNNYFYRNFFKIMSESIPKAKLFELQSKIRKKYQCTDDHDTKDKISKQFVDEVHHNFCLLIYC